MKSEINLKSWVKMLLNYPQAIIGLRSYYKKIRLSKRQGIDYSVFDPDLSTGFGPNPDRAGGTKIHVFINYHASPGSSPNPLRRGRVTPILSSRCSEQLYQV